MNNSISAPRRILGLDILGMANERTEGNRGRVVLAVAIVAVTLGAIYLPYLLELLWS